MNIHEIEIQYYQYNMLDCYLLSKDLSSLYYLMPYPVWLNLAVLCSVLDELNEKVQFSSKVHFYGELELNLVHFLAKWTWTELSSLFGWTWTKMN